MATKANTETVESVMKAGKDQFESAVKSGSEAARKNFEQTVETAKKYMDDAIKSCDDLASVGRENMDACLAAQSATAKAVESINSEFFTLSKNAYESNLSACKALSAAKTPKDFFDIQSALVKGRYDEALASVNKINGLVTVAASDVVAPLNARVTATVDKFSKSFV